MTDNKDLIQELEVLGNSKIYPNGKKALFDAINLIKSQQEENDRLECVLLGVMHFVDKWLEGDELKQDEVNRASAMREKTLQIVENLQSENKGLINNKCEDCAGCTQWLCDCSNERAQAIREFVDEIQKEINILLKEYYERKKEREFELEQASYSLIIDRTLQYYRGKIEVLDAINLLINTKLKEMAGDKL